MGRQKAALRHWQLSHLHMKATEKKQLHGTASPGALKPFHHLHFPLSNLREHAFCISLACSSAPFPL